MHNDVSDKPKNTPSVNSIESTQEDKSNLPSVGYRIRMLVGYGKNEEMNATIITNKEQVDYQFGILKETK